jgi:Type IV secretion-system coupling protein DNA-binding domain
MSHDSDRRTHADALRRHNRTNQTARFKRQAGIMLASIALGAIILPYAMLDKEILQAAATYHVAQAKSWFAEGTAAKPTMIIRIDGIDYTAPTDAVVAHPYYRDCADAVFATFKSGAVLGFAGWLAGLFLLRGVAARRREAALRDRVIAGTLVTSEAQLARLTGSEADARALHIGTVPLPNRLETRHMAMIGTTGSGKTTALRQMLDGIEARGEAALVYDTSGEFVAHCCPAAMLTGAGLSLQASPPATMSKPKPSCCSLRRRGGETCRPSRRGWTPPRPSPAPPPMPSGQALTGIPTSAQRPRSF